MGDGVLGGVRVGVALGVGVGVGTAGHGRSPNAHEPVVHCAPAGPASGASSAVAHTPTLEQ